MGLHVSTISYFAEVTNLGRMAWNVNTGTLVGHDRMEGGIDLSDVSIGRYSLYTSYRIPDNTSANQVGTVCLSKLWLSNPAARDGSP